MTKAINNKVTKEDILKAEVKDAASSIAIGKLRRAYVNDNKVMDVHKTIAVILMMELGKEVTPRQATDYRNAIKKSYTKIFSDNGRTLKIEGKVKDGFKVSSVKTPPKTVTAPPTQEESKDSVTTTNTAYQEMVESAKAYTVEEKVALILDIIGDDEKAVLTALGFSKVA